MHLLKERRGAWLLILAVVVFHAVTNLVWLSKDSLTAGCDVLEHLNESSVMLDDLRKIGATRDYLRLTDILWNERVPVWPRTVYLVGLAIRPITGDSHFWLVWTNGVLFLGLCIVATFLLGRSLYDHKVGVLAAVLVSFAPGIYGLSRKYGLDLPITGLLTICFWRLHLLDLAGRTKTFFHFGLLVGLCLLVKLQSIFLLLVPLAGKLRPVVWRRWSKATPASTGPVNVGGAVMVPILAIFVSALFWGGHLDRLLEVLLGHSLLQELHYPSAVFPDHALHHKLFYLASAWAHLSVPIFGAFLLCALKFSRREWKLMGIYIIPPLLFFSLVMMHRWGRYLFPTIPWVAILVARTLTALRPRRHVLAVTAFLVLVGLNYFDTSFWATPGVARVKADLARLTGHEGTYATTNEPTNHLALLTHMAAVIEDQRQTGRPPRVAVINTMSIWDAPGCDMVSYVLRVKLRGAEVVCQQNVDNLADHLPFDFYVVAHPRRSKGPVTLPPAIRAAINASRALASFYPKPVGGTLTLLWSSVAPGRAP